MTDHRKFYIDGKWVSPLKCNDFAVVNPATEEPIASIVARQRGRCRSGRKRG